MIKFLVLNDNYDYIVQKELFWSRVGVQEMVAGGQGIGCYMMSKECESLGRSHKWRFHVTKVYMSNIW